MEPFDVRGLPDEGIDLDQPIDAEWLNNELNDPDCEPDARLMPKGDGVLSLRIERTNPDDSFSSPTIRIFGESRAMLATSCVSCLEALALELLAKIDLVLFPAGHKVRETPMGATRPAGRPDEAPDEPEPSGTPDAEDGTYADGLVDLPWIVREALLLALDMNPRCTDEKACEARTLALMKSAGVTPPEPEPDPRWDALRKFDLK